MEDLGNGRPGKYMNWGNGGPGEWKAREMQDLGIGGPGEIEGPGK